jgi:hypothetical protein
MRFGAPLVDEIKSQLLSAGQSCQSGETPRVHSRHASVVDADDVDPPEYQRHRIHKPRELRKFSKPSPMQGAVESRDHMSNGQASSAAVKGAMLA